jgi:hypothetical protein
MEKEKIKSWTPGLRDSYHTSQANPSAANPGYATSYSRQQVIGQIYFMWMDVKDVTALHLVSVFINKSWRNKDESLSITKHFNHIYYDANFLL